MGHNLLSDRGASYEQCVSRDEPCSCRQILDRPSLAVYPTVESVGNGQAPYAYHASKDAADHERRSPGRGDDSRHQRQTASHLDEQE